MLILIDISSLKGIFRIQRQINNYLFSYLVHYPINYQYKVRFAFTNMSYQNPTEESYGTDTLSSSQQQNLLPNVGISNSSRGQGTTLPEITSKLRFSNCGASIFIVLFHTVPRIVNPIRLAMLLASPVQFVLELVLGCFALSLFFVEARIPIIGERVLDLVRRCKIDLDVARGRMTVLMIMTGACGMIQYLNYVSKYGGDEYIPLVPDDTGGESNANSTIVANATLSNPTMDTSDTAISVDIDDGSKRRAHSFVFIILYCIISAPTMWILVALMIYTLYIMQTYPDYEHSRAYVEPSESGGIAPNTGSDGYQTAGAPFWAKPAGIY